MSTKGLLPVLVEKHNDIDSSNEAKAGVVIKIRMYPQESAAGGLMQTASGKVRIWNEGIDAGKSFEKAKKVR